MLKAGGGLIALALVQAGGRLFSWSWTLVACRSVLGGVFGRWRAVRPERVRQLVGYGIRNAIGETALLVIYRLDLTVIGVFVGVSRITGYSIAGTLVGYASALCTNIAYVFTPRFAHLASRGDDAAARELYFFGLRVTGLLVVAMMGGLLVFGRSFITLWLGPSYVSGAWSDRSDVIMIVLIAGYLPHMLQSISRQRLFAMAKVRFLMWLNVGEAAANLVLSVILAKRYGPVGVAFGTLIPLLVTQLAVMPRYTSRVFQGPAAGATPARLRGAADRRAADGLRERGLPLRGAAPQLGHVLLRRGRVRVRRGSHHRGRRADGRRTPRGLGADFSSRTPPARVIVRRIAVAQGRIVC